jgi:uncharacterized protein (TIGR03083 family)
VTIGYEEILRREGGLFVRAAEVTLDAPVEHCPEWTVADLVAHMHEVLVFWHSIATTRAGTPEEGTRATRPADDELVASLRRAFTDMLAIYAMNPNTPCWNWSQARHDVGWVQRRMAQEALIHRWDAELAATGHTTAFEPAVAADGIDEYVSVFVPGEEEHLVGPAIRIALTATDTGDSWTLTAGDGTSSVTRACDAADATVTGRAEDILLLWWARAPSSAVTIDGDLVAFDEFRARLDNS